MKKQVHVVYSGRVQGVGFRYTCVDTALGMGVKGWVRNLSDGRVELAAEAEEETLNAFLKALSDKFSAYIRSADTAWGPVSDGFGEFTIKF